MMPIWRLTPQHLEDPAWHDSTYTGTVLVRAGDGPAARLLATQRFGKGTAVQPGHFTLWHPWTQERLVTCTLEPASPYPEDGPTTVLWPERLKI